MAQEDVEKFHKMSQLFELSVSILQRMENPPSSESPEELAVFIDECTRYQTLAKESGDEAALEFASTLENVLGPAKDLQQTLVKRAEAIDALERKQLAGTEALDIRINELDEQLLQLDKQKLELLQQQKSKLQELEKRRERLERIARIQQMIAGACAIVAVFCWPSLFARIVLAIAILIYLNATL